MIDIRTSLIATTSAIGKDGGGGGTDVADCVMTDEKGKLLRAEEKVDALIDKACSIPYPMTCPEPCETTDDGGATTDIDDDPELKDCLLCFNIGIGWSGSAATPLTQGVFGAIQNGATVPSTKDGYRCQT